MAKATIKAKTPEECRDRIVEFLKHQGHSYHSAGIIADRKLVKKQAQVKADLCMGLALFLDGCVIDKE